MLEKLSLRNIGPASEMEAEFGRRLNLITGDNGLGKSFLLDACWFGHTGTWAGGRRFFPGPEANKASPPFVGYSLIGENERRLEGAARFNFLSQSWSGGETWTDKERPQPGLVAYAHIDGGFSVWDTMRHDKVKPHEISIPVFDFTKEELWNGLPLNAARPEEIICNGLIRDVETWRLKGNGAFALLQNVLKGLSPDQREVLKIGESVRVGNSVQDIPTLRMPYGPVPVTQAASGIRRVLSLAYLLVWAWEEHKRAAALKQEEPTRHIALLIDEVEAHLHPKWQRVFLPALLNVVESLLLDHAAESVQIIATTHAPLILGSVETLWDNERDQLFDFDLENGKVELEAIPFEKHGSAENWLESDSFDLPSGYSTDAQTVMQRADAFMATHPDATKAPSDEADATHAELKRVLGGDDEYWPYWKPYYRRLSGKK